MEKNIKIYKKYQSHITNIESEKQKVHQIIQNIYQLYLNESNENNKDYAVQSLDEYKYVNYKFSINPGSYLRYIDTSNHKDMKLKLGGFVINDNGLMPAQSAQHFGQNVLAITIRWHRVQPVRRF